MDCTRPEAIVHRLHQCPATCRLDRAARQVLDLVLARFFQQGNYDRHLTLRAKRTPAWNGRLPRPREQSRGGGRRHPLRIYSLVSDALFLAPGKAPSKLHDHPKALGEPNQPAQQIRDLLPEVSGSGCCHTEKDHAKDPKDPLSTRGS